MPLKSRFLRRSGVADTAHRPAKKARDLALARLRCEARQRDADETGLKINNIDTQKNGCPRDKLTPNNDVAVINGLLNEGPAFSSGPNFIKL